MNRGRPFIAILLLLAACHNLQPQSVTRAESVPPPELISDPSPSSGRLALSVPSAQRYQQVKDWPQLPAGYHLGNPSGIGVDSQQNILVFCRAGRAWPLILPMPTSVITANTILILDRYSGKIINSWGAGLFIMPHSLTVDKDNNIWVTDVGLHQVFKFSHEGRLLLKLGEARVSGQDSAHFNRPTDVAVAADGSFYVSDGYRNSRIVKFAPSGQYLFEWGRKGEGPGEFDIPHGIDLDEKGNVYVADRENRRIQVFDVNGKFIKEWRGEDVGRICAVRYDKTNKELIAVDYVTNYITPKGSDILVFDSTGKLLTRFGRSGAYSGPVCWYHDVAVDKDGSIYVGDILGNTLLKFEKKK